MFKNNYNVKLQRLVSFFRQVNYNTEERVCGMTRRQQIVMACIGVGSLVYIIILQVSETYLMLDF